MAGHQLDVRISEEYRELLRLLVYLDDASESVVVCAGLLTYANVALQDMVHDGLDNEPEAQLLVRTLARCEGGVSPPVPCD